MSNCIAHRIAHWRSNSLSPEPCALIPFVVLTHSFIQTTPSREAEAMNEGVRA